MSNTKKANKNKNETPRIQNLNELLVLELFTKNPNKMYGFNELLSNFGINKNDRNALKIVLKKLTSKHKIQRFNGRKYKAQELKHYSTGTIEPVKSGAAFVETEIDTYFIPIGHTGISLPGDTVSVEVMAAPKDKKPEARVINVIKRKKQTFTGEIKKEHKINYVAPSSNFIKVPVFIPEGRLRKAKPGDLVVFEIQEWENEYSNPVGRVTEVIGESEENTVNILYTARSMGAVSEFPANVLQEVDKMEELSFDDLGGRTDFRNEMVITIDPEDAKDFDDAVSIEKLPNGNILLKVHIADVTAYVRENTALDSEALKRATSIYLINKVIPMLPEKLSNNFCSLVPNKDRAVYSAVITCTPEGKVVEFDFCEGVINSKRRFSYDEVQDILDGKTKDKLYKKLTMMNNFAKVLRKNRFKQGGLDFYIPESKLILDKDDIPVKIIKLESNDSHRMIEELMLLTNQLAPKFFKKLENKHKTSLAFAYRVHDKPDPEKVEVFAALARTLGCNVNKGTPGSSIWFQNVIKHFEENEDLQLIENIALRSMMKAIYQQQNVGHFGLGFTDYTHFTSPIRRYPDLMIHRLLKKYTADSLKTNLPELKRKVTRICKHVTEKEIAAMRMEREVVKLKKLEFLQDRAGDVFFGVVSGVQQFGIYVELADVLTDGMIHVRDLKGDYYTYDEKSYSLSGERTGKSYKIGDKIKVQIAKVNIKKGHLDLIPAR